MPEMTPELKARFQALVDRNDDIFACSMRDLGEYRGDVGPAHIELAHQRPIHQRPRSHSVEEYAAMDVACKELLDAGIIEESRSSAFAMNSTLPPKWAADGTWMQRRFCTWTHGISTLQRCPTCTSRRCPTSSSSKWGRDVAHQDGLPAGRLPADSAGA
jgi:hypothetical protein